MPYSVIVGKDVIDIRIKKQTDFIYSIWLDKECLGQVFRMRSTWSAVPSTPHSLSPFTDLATRIGAIDLLVKIWKANNQDNLGD